MNIVPLLYVRIRKFCKEKNMEVSDIRHMTFVISLKKKAPQRRSPPGFEPA